ncbi:PREDICTED: uncharacterized protein LOC109219556 [Nicotiana attenuata]|uniref:uncharacterized protein LOC109219556 n=1 Tax=Nicotiana attenuata TaxID=49451 RepID=UPI000905C691|nr:PREDICTED: uncharacterized protein LOC109219556 [Nicotiana attenuata]
MAGVPFILSHLIHLYSPKLFRQGVFTLVARSKRVLVNPEDEKDRGWYARFIAAPTVGLVGDENVPFPEKWNFAYSEEEEEQDEGSLIKKPRARRRIISDNEASPPRSTPHTEPVEGPLVIPDDDTPAAAHDSSEQLFTRGFGSESLKPISDEAPLTSFPLSAPTIPSLPFEDVPVAASPPAILTPSTAPPSTVLTSSTIPPTTVKQSEVGSSSRGGAMRQVIIEVPADGNLLRKSGGADVWLKPLIGPIEKAKLESHNSLTLMNDIIHSSLKINLVGTEMMKRISHTEQLMHEYQVEADNWREQFESLQIDMEALEENKCTLEQQLRNLTSELAVERASSNQASKDKNLLETSFSEQLSKASEEIRELKVLLSRKEAYAGELVQTLTQTQEDLRESSGKVRFLESSHASLQISYDSALVENEKLKSEIAEWEKDYEILEDKTAIEVSWAFLNSRHDTLVEVSQENFNLEAELAKIKETIKKTQQSQDFSSPVAETSENIEDDTGTMSAPFPSSQVEPAAADDSASVPSSTP